MRTHIEKAKQIIANDIYMTVATASLDGKPWISPVFFAYDKHYNLFWVSSKNSLHSILISNNPQVAIVIFDSTAPEGEGDGVYFEAEACELKGTDEIESAIETLADRVSKDDFRVRKIDEVTDKSAWRIYRAIPKMISKLTAGEYVDGHYVDKRIEMDLRSFQ